jgi:hypothetical protein
VRALGLEIAEQLQLGFDFAQYRAWQATERLAKAPIIDRATLIDHHLALGGVARDATRQLLRAEVERMKIINEDTAKFQQKVINFADPMVMEQLRKFLNENQ